MSIILNEKAYVEKMIAEKSINEKNLGPDLFLLVKYLYHQGNKRKEILSFVESFMGTIPILFDIKQWTSYLDKYISRASKQALWEIESIPVTRNEFETIRKIKNPRHERYMFALLVLAKLNNIKSETNNGWVNHSDKVTFQAANINGDTKSKNSTIFTLKEKGLITLGKNALHPNIKVNIIDDSTDVILNITSMDDLGFQYTRLLPNNFIKECSSCGKLFKGKSKQDKTRICPTCKNKEKKEYVVTICAKCGKKFAHSPQGHWAYLCPEHQDELNRSKRAQYIRKKRQRIKELTETEDAKTLVNTEQNGNDQSVLSEMEVAQ